MSETPIEKMLRESREKRLTTAQALSTPAVPTQPVNPAWSKYAGVYTEVDSTEQPKSLEADKLQEIIRNLPIRRVFEEVLHGKYKNSYAQTRNSGEVSIHCPNPSHTDNNASASMNLDTGLWTCYTCNDTGTDKLVLAAYAWGYPVPIPTGDSTAWEIKKRLAKQLAGWDYDAAVEAARAERAARAPLPPGSPEAKARAEVDAEIEAETLTEEQAFLREVERIARRHEIKLRGEQEGRLRFSISEFVPPDDEDDGLSLDQELALPIQPIQWRIDKLHAVGSNTLILAQQKTGKTTCMMNLIKSLADQEPFLGEFEVSPFEGNILYLNYEVHKEMARRQLSEIGIRNGKRVFHRSLRGRPFDLMDDLAVAWLANTYLIPHDISILIIDPLHGALSPGMDENSNSDITRWTKRLDQITHDFNIQDVFLPVHTGKGEGTQDRVRGASRLDDWYDYFFIVKRDTETDLREFKTDGRGPQIEPRVMQYDEATRKLTLGTKNLRQSTYLSYTSKVLEQIVNLPGVTKTTLHDFFNATSSEKRNLINSAIEALVSDGSVVAQTIQKSGPGKKPIGYWELSAAPPPSLGAGVHVV